MRANISDELINAIDDMIYFDLMVHVSQKRYMKAVLDGNEGYAEYLDRIYKEIKKDRQMVATYLKSNGVKLYEVVKDGDGEFVEYPYAQKIMGGYKEGTMRYWRYAIKLELKNRMSKYYGGD